MFQVINRAVDQVRTVIGIDDLHTLRKGGLDVLDSLLHALDDLLRVLAEPHDDNTADRFPLAIQFTDATPHVGPEGHRGQVLHQHGRAGLWVRHDHDVADVSERFDVAAPSHHILPTRHFHQPGADIVVALLNGFHDHVDRDLIAKQLVGIDVDLILSNKATQGGYFCDARYGL